jgi:hypothetical protein
MKVQEVFMRALAKEISWIQAAEIIGDTARLDSTVRGSRF